MMNWLSVMSKRMACFHGREGDGKKKQQLALQRWRSIFASSFAILSRSFSLNLVEGFTIDAGKEIRQPGAILGIFVACS